MNLAPAGNQNLLFPKRACQLFQETDRVHDADGRILHASVSTGTQGRETPAGIFAVLEKNKDHRSNMYDDAEMPNMHRITWNGIALHGGPLPGYPASHGCVRMPAHSAGIHVVMHWHGRSRPRADRPATLS